MKRTTALILIASVLSLLAPYTRADDAADATKAAHDFVTALATMDFDKAMALGRPGDTDKIPKPPDDLQRMIHDLQDVPEVQDIRRQMSDEATKALSIGPPALTPDNTCAIIMVIPVAAEGRKFSELLTLYTTYLSAATQAKTQKLSMPKVADIRARILAPGSPELAVIESQAEAFPTQKLRLQLEKTPAGWRVNLHAFQAALNPDSSDSP